MIVARKNKTGKKHVLKRKGSNDSFATGTQFGVAIANADASPTEPAADRPLRGFEFMLSNGMEEEVLIVIEEVDELEAAALEFLFALGPQENCIFQGIELEEDEASNPVSVVSVADTIAACLERSVESCDQVLDEDSAEWERKFDASSTVLCNSQWVVDLKTVKSFSTSAFPASSAYKSSLNVLKNIYGASVNGFTEGLGLLTDSTSVHIVVEHAIDEMEADMKRKKVYIESLLSSLLKISTIIGFGWKVKEFSIRRQEFSTRRKSLYPAAGRASCCGTGINLRG
jgi:hypothetical protein